MVCDLIGRNPGLPGGTDDHQVELMFECELEETAAPELGASPNGAVGVSWLPVADLDEYRLYPKVLRTILKNGIPKTTPVYLGDVD